MPQLDITYYISQAFWSVLCFMILFLYIRFFILPRILSMIKTRNNILHNNKQAVLHLNNKSDALKADFYSRLSDIRDHKDNIINDAIFKSEKDHQESVLVLEEYIDDILSSNNTRLALLEEELASRLDDVKEYFSVTLTDVVINNYRR